MKSKTSADHKKQTIVVKDLKTKKNPKGGLSLNYTKIKIDYKESAVGNTAPTRVGIK